MVERSATYFSTKRVSTRPRIPWPARMLQI